MYQQVRGDLVRRYRLTPVHGRYSMPGEVILRLLVVKHLYGWSYDETVERVADSLVGRWICRVYCQRAPDATTLLRWARTVQPTTLQALIERVALLAKQARVTQARKLRVLTRLVLRAKPPLQDQLSSGTRRVFRNRRRATRRALQALYRVVRRKAQTSIAHAQQRPLYERLIQLAEQTLQQARTVGQALERLADQRDPSRSRASTPPTGRVQAAGGRGAATHLGAAHRLQAELERFLLTPGAMYKGLPST